MLILLVAVAVSAFIGWDSCYAEDSQTIIVVDGIGYNVLEEGRVEAVSCDERTDLFIPDHVSSGGVTYEVVSVNLIRMFSNEIRTVSIPSTAESITGLPLLYEGIESFEVREPNLFFDSLDGVIYNEGMSTLLRMPPAYPEKRFLIPDTVSLIADYAFSLCEGLKDVVAPESLLCIGDSAFLGCSSLEFFNNAGGVNSLPESLIVIDSYAFYDCSELDFGVLPEGLRFIGDMAFSGTGLTSVCIGPEVGNIGEGAFSNCTRLEEFDSANYYFRVLDGVLMHPVSQSSTYCVLLSYPAGSHRTSYRIPDEVQDIGQSAFEGCVHLEEVTMSHRMTSVPALSFHKCTSLKKAVLTDSILSVDMMAFSNCDNLEAVEWGPNLAYISECAFMESGIKDLAPPPSLTYVGVLAFSGCPALKEARFQSEDLYLDSEAFLMSYSLERVVFEGAGTILASDSLAVGTARSEAALTVEVQKGTKIPEDLANEYTALDVIVAGERPYPYENLIGVAACIIVLILMVRLFREV